MCNITSYGTTLLTFEQNKLLSYNDGSGVVNFTYDFNGKRISKSNGNTLRSFNYDGNRLIREKIKNLSTGVTKDIYYLHGVDGIIGFVYEGEEYLFYRNAFRDVEAIYNSQGTLVGSYEYDPFGNTTITLDTNGFASLNPIRYRGYYYDVETQLFYCNSRYYSSELCRWISLDSIEYLDPSSINDLNLYSYCGNDPVNRYDPSGHFWDYVLDAAFIGLGIYDFSKEPSWSKAGWLALDIALAIIPIIPTLSGARHLGKVDNALDLVNLYGHTDNVIDASSTLNKIDSVGDLASRFRYADNLIDCGQEIGTYLLKNADGDVIYVGKGSMKRMMKSYDLKNASSWLYYPAKNADIALANEAYFMSIYGGAQSMMKNYKLIGGYENASRLFNKINSPGLRYLFYWF